MWDFWLHKLYQWNEPSLDDQDLLDKTSKSHGEFARNECCHYHKKSTLTRKTVVKNTCCMSVIHSSISRIQTKPYRINSRQNPGILVNQYNCVTWIAKKAVPAVWNKSKCKADRDFPCRPEYIELVKCIINMKDSLNTQQYWKWFWMLKKLICKQLGRKSYSLEDIFPWWMWFYSVIF